MLSFVSLQAVIFDMDGVIWRGDEAQPGVPQVFDYLTRQGLPFVFATNNSSKTPDMYVDKLAHFGIHTTPERIMTSAIATAHYVRRAYPQAKQAYIVGREGLIEALAAQGIHHTDQQADVVVVGFDPTLTYDKLRAASYQIQGGAPFIGANPDKSFPEPGGFAPGAGSILAALEAATGQAPYIVGKPHPPMFEAALDILNTPAAHTLMVGDRLETDIQGAITVGLRSALVLGGISTRADIETGDIQPEAIFDHLADLLAHWQQAASS